MSLFQGIILLFIGLLVLSFLYIGYRVAAYQLDKRLPRPVQEVPSKVSTQPPQDWWDALQGLRMHVDTQVSQMRAEAGAAAQALRTARSVEERTRRRGKVAAAPQPELEWDDQEEEPVVQPVLPVPAGWEGADRVAAAPTPPVPNGDERFAAMIAARRGRS